MPDRKSKWTLAELIDFEVALATAKRKAARLDPAENNRSRAMHEWLHQQKFHGPGQRWVTGMATVSVVLGLVSLIAGAGAVWGTLHPGTAGVHVIWLMAVTLWLPWLLLLAGVMGWAMRHRFGGLSLFSKLLEKLSLRFLSESTRGGIQHARRSSELASVLAWRLARQSQQIAAHFHVGAFLGLTTMVLFKKVGFFWETTTESAVQNGLQNLVSWMAFPWEQWLGTPDVPGSRSDHDWMELGVGWWPFLGLSLLLYGVLPRLLLALFAAFRERNLLANLAFQAPHHRKLWRSLTEVQRGENLQGPVDGALIITLGGDEPDHGSLRPFLLRRLRLNPMAWESLGVLNRDREEAARDALEKSPAGIVMIAEGWSLAPRQIERALQEVTARAEGRRCILLIGNVREGRMEAVPASEREQWERFMDERSQNEVECIFYEPI